MERISGCLGTRLPVVHKPILYLALSLFLLLSLWVPDTLGAGEIAVVDDLGQHIRMDRPARRIIALYGAYNEILAGMRLEDRLVGRTKTDRLPPSILSKPAIGTHMRPNVELVLGVKPDLVIQGAGRREALMAVSQLQREGLHVVVFNPTSFTQLFSVIRRLGVLTGEMDGAKKLVASLQARLDGVHHRLQGLSHRPSVFFEIRYPNLLGAGRRSIVNDIIETSGGTNCVTVDKKLARIDMETLIACNPGAYIVQRGPMNPNPGRPGTRPHFAILRAVKEGKVLVVDEQVYSRPGPRAVDGVEELAAFLHPERFE